MNAQHSLLAKSLPIVAQALGDKLGVKVVIGQTQGAMTDGKTIFLPPLPADDAKTLVLANGYIDHEAAHVRFSDDKPFKHMKSELEKHVTNLFEDIRIEKAMGRLYPGCKSNLANLAHVMVEDGSFRAASAKEHPATVLECFLLNRLRADVLKQHAVDDIANKSTQVFKEVFPKGAFTRVAALMYKVDELKCSLDTFNLAREVLTVLEEEQKNEEQQQEKVDSQTQGDTGDSQDDNNAQGNADPEDVSSNDDTDSGNGKASGDSSDENPSQNCDSQSGDGQGDEGSDASGGKGHGKFAENIERALNAGDDDLLDDIGSMLAEKLNDQAEDVTESSGIVVGTANRNSELNSSNNSDLMNEACLLTNGLRARLTGLVQSQNREHVRLEQTGQEIAVDQLHRVATLDFNVFKQKTHQQAANTAVQILLDCSGSMNEDMHIAKIASLATAHALDLIKGVSVGAAAFPGFGRDDVEVLSLLGETVRHHASSYDIRAHGSTPMAEAMWWAATQLANSEEPRKILLVVTDGDPNGGSEYSIDTLFHLCRRSNIECLGLGIGQLTIADKFPIYHTIKTVNELSGAMFEMMKKRLLTKAA